MHLAKFPICLWRGDRELRETIGCPRRENNRPDELNQEDNPKQSFHVTIKISHLRSYPSWASEIQGTSVEILNDPSSRSLRLALLRFS